MLIGLQIDLWRTIIIIRLKQNFNNWLVWSHKFYSLFLNHSSCWWNGTEWQQQLLTFWEQQRKWQWWYIAISSSYMQIFFYLSLSLNFLIQRICFSNWMTLWFESLMTLLLIEFHNQKRNKLGNFNYGREQKNCFFPFK